MIKRIGKGVSLFYLWYSQFLPFCLLCLFQRRRKIQYFNGFSGNVYKQICAIKRENPMNIFGKTSIFSDQLAAQ